ncbi:MAG: NAD-dependent succinate-semialdehyde dehydrogenase [Deltaproteobacteria bacterium]|nr:NAD-dependent succinate-semialdehyde dehydrogenase [Deltaproteobacteria bacterium]
MNFGYKKLYLDGRLRDSFSGERKDVICPATEEKVAEIAWATKEDAECALESAQKGFEIWSQYSLEKRTRWMLKLREAVIAKEELLRESIMYEMGKPWEGTEEDYETVVNALKWYPEEMRHRRDEILTDVENTHRHQIITQPVGVAVAFLAWNFPLLNVGFKIGPALASGCSLIIRPSGSSPLSAYILGEILHEVDFPKGVVNILCGPTNEVAETLSKSTITRVITMIGSSETGRKLMVQSATSIKRMSMELGGNAPALIFNDADLPRAANEVAALKFGNCGQICVSPNRIFVHKEVFCRFEKLFIEKVREIKIGFGREFKPTMGPLIDLKARERIEGMVKDALDKGAKLVCGGKIPQKPSKGYFYEPTILTNVTSDMRVFREEIFGPIAALIEFDDDDKALEMANDTEYGLSSYLYTKDVNRIQRFSENLQFGEVHINGFKYSIYLPHGGIKESGIGHDCSHLALEDYLVKKRITIKC